MFGINDAYSSLSQSNSKKNLMYPFATLGNAATPEYFRTALSYIEFLWVSGQSSYSSAIKSAIALNITKLTYTDTEKEGELNLQSKNVIEKDITQILGSGMRELINLGSDLMSYGNAFRSIAIPFTRTLVCPKCKTHYDLKYVLENPSIFGFNFQQTHLKPSQDSALPMMGECTCADKNCKYRGAFYVKDIASDTKDKIAIIRWRPQDIYIEAGSFSGSQCIYHYRANAEVKRNVQEGRTLTLLTFPIELLYAISRGETFQFNEGELFHLRDNTLSGVLTYGWGISRMISHFQLIWQLACLYKINEAISVDYSVPKRLITPAPRAGASDGVTADPAGTIDLLPYLHSVKSMWDTQEHGQVQFLPFPVQYQLLGGEAKNLVPDNLIAQAEDALLSALDVPPELYRNTLAVDGAPLALTIFQNKWAWFRAEIEIFLQWLTDKLQPRLGWSPVKIGIMPLKLDADLGRQQFLAQLAMQEIVSWSTAMDGAGINFLEEKRRIIDEKKTVMEMEKELEEQGITMGMLPNITKSMDPAAAGQQPPPPEQMGGMPPMPGMGGGAAPMSPQAQGIVNSGISPNDYEKLSPQDLLGLAESYASQVFQAGATGGRRQMLNQLRNDMPETLYGAIKEALRKLDQQASSQGKQLIQQQGGAV